MITKLIKEENKNRPKIIAIDFDDTIANDSFPDISKATLKENADKIINRLYDEGYYIIIWTCRFSDKHINDMINFLKGFKIKYNNINKNYEGLTFTPYPKIYYDVLIDDRSFIKDIKWDMSMYYYIKTKLVDNPLITGDMKDHFYNRTINHIISVNKYGMILNKGLKTYELVRRLEMHDFNKFQNPEIEPYIFITWSYYCKDNNIDFPIPDELQNIMNKATEHHILNSSHHPEYWQDKKEGLININSRDGVTIPNGIIDATKMEDLSIIEMVADWCGMSDERKNTPRDWADKVINKRWKFTDKQKYFIYEMIDKAWLIK
jgi:hydroxymethylpyrimidine pyrophosphatase-like HAD family hydrolase